MPEEYMTTCNVRVCLHDKVVGLENRSLADEQLARIAAILCGSSLLRSVVGADAFFSLPCLVLLDKNTFLVLATVERLYLAVVTFGIDNVKFDTLLFVVLVTLLSETLEDKWFTFLHNVTRFACVALRKTTVNGGYYIL